MFALSALGMQAACYTLDPSFGSTPTFGTHVAFDINDAGRVALAGPMSPEIARIEGRLVTADSSEYLLAVTSLHTIRDAEQPWTGEQVHIKRDWVGTTYQQHFSPVRTTLLTAALVGVVAAVADAALNGFATPPATGVTKPDTAEAIRFPVRGRGGRFINGIRFIKRW